MTEPPTLPLPDESPDTIATHAEDLALVESVLAGSDAAWSALVERYTGLIHSVIRRYIRSRDVDDRHTVYVAVLSHLYHRKLATFRGESSLATWLVLVTRSETLDHLRHAFGRRVVPRGLKEMSEDDRRLYRLYYIEGVGFEGVLARMRGTNPERNAAWLIEALDRLEQQLDDRHLRRLAYDLHAHSVGAASGRLLEYLDHARSEFAAKAGAFSPDFQLMEAESRRTLEQVLQLIERLPAEERHILQLRFEQRWTAERIAQELGIENRRRVYTLLEGTIRRLRSILGV